MPELADVEYFRKRWDAGLGKRIVAVQLHGEKRLFRETEARTIERQLVRQKLLYSVAHGKQMLFALSGGNWLGIHLGMSGNLRVEAANFKTGKHDHRVLRHKDRALVFSDARQFGLVRFHHGRETPAWWDVSTPEIHSREFTKVSMRAFVRRHARAPVKALLLLQKGFPGIGNWMADEILWRAKIAPLRIAGSLSAAERARLFRETRFVATESLRIIAPEFGDPPRDWLIHQKWKRAGVCPKHRTPLQKAMIGGRTTAWCPRCQK